MNTIPGAETAYLQVLVSKPFREHLKRLYSKWLLVREYILTPWGYKKPSVKPLCQWVKTMAKFSPEVMARAF